MLFAINSPARLSREYNILWVLPEMQVIARSHVMIDTVLHQLQSLCWSKSIDTASQALAQAVPPGVPNSHRALADHSGLSRSTLHRRAHGETRSQRRLRANNTLRPWLEDDLVKYLLQISYLGHLLRIMIPALAFDLTRYRSVAERPSQPPDRNWPKAFEIRHPEFGARWVEALDWDRHKRNIYGKARNGLRWSERSCKIQISSFGTCGIWIRRESYYACRAWSRFS